MVGASNSRNVCEQCNNLQDPKSILMVTDFNFSPMMFLRYWILVHCQFNKLFLRLLQRKKPTFLYLSFLLNLSERGRTLKVVQQFAIRRLLAYKLSACKKPSVSKRLSAKVYTLPPFCFTSLQKQHQSCSIKKLFLNISQ